MPELDIRKGDYLISGTDTYAVKETEWWEMENANTPAFLRLATATYSTKRLTFTAGKREKVSDASAHLSDLKGTPLDVVSADLGTRVGLEALHTLRHTQISNATGYMVVIVEKLE